MKTRLLTWPRSTAASQEITLDHDQARHGLLVLRLKEGDSITLASPWGLAEAVVTRADRQTLTLALKLVGDFSGTECWGPTLALPLIRPSRFDWAVEKAVELGARRLWPIVPQRARSQESSPQKLARWERLAEEARKQCARSAPLVISAILSWPDFLAEAAAFPGPRLLLAPEGGSWPDLEEEPLLLIGPEGGFNEAERLTLADLDFLPISLGPRTLRTETAALAALAQWSLLSPDPSKKLP
ncbi:MAG: 16S rRNA (uracil(1498)-N(3))-methyltransferase [Deltaproteobacteria bacterium]|nr:16S rRNA (uracil(1498)-N(3))-methyltransferase [Deltaproteobacteria bacterium]